MSGKVRAHLLDIRKTSGARPAETPKPKAGLYLALPLHRVRSARARGSCAGSGLSVLHIAGLLLNKRPPESLQRSITAEEKIEQAGSSIDEVSEKVIPFVRKYGDRSEEYASR